jgi:hypothetical protein
MAAHAHTILKVARALTGEQRKNYIQSAVEIAPGLWSDGLCPSSVSSALWMEEGEDPSDELLDRLRAKVAWMSQYKDLDAMLASIRPKKPWAKRRLARAMEYKHV